MASLSSIHIETSSASADIHNQRVFSPDYLISAKDVSYLVFNPHHINKLEKMARQDYQAHSKNHRAMPKNATLIKEAIVNLKEDTTEEELRELQRRLEKEFGYTVKSISVHRDEGYIYTDEKNYTMGREQYVNDEETPYIAELNPKDGNFYEWKKVEDEWVNQGEILDYEIEHNHHAHIQMLNFNFETHRTIRPQHKDMSRMQTVVAESLNMVRGKCSSTVEAKRLGVPVEASRKRMNIRAYKQMKQQESNTKIQTDEKIDILKNQVSEKNLNLEMSKKLYQNSVQDVKKLVETTIGSKHEGNGVSRAVDTIKEMKAELAKVGQVKKQYKAEYHELKASVGTSKEEYRELKLKYVQLEELARKKKLTIQQLEEQISQKDRDIDTLKNTIKERNMNINQSFDVIEKKNSKIRDLEQNISQKDRYISTLEDTIQSKEGVFIRLEEQISKQQELISQLQNQETKVVEKPVYIEQIVEKIVYKDKIVENPKTKKYVKELEEYVKKMKSQNLPRENTLKKLKNIVEENTDVVVKKYSDIISVVENALTIDTGTTERVKELEEQMKNQSVIFTTALDAKDMAIEELQEEIEKLSKTTSLGYK